MTAGLPGVCRPPDLVPRTAKTKHLKTEREKRRRKERKGVKERHDQTRIRPRKRVQEDPETDRSWDHDTESTWCVGRR